MLMGQVVNKMPAPHLRRKDDALVDSDTMLGIEVEIEGVASKLPTKDKEAAYWEMKEDHSLRNNGMEFVFKEPLFGADVVIALSYLFQKAQEKGWKVSERTGIHVHVDVRSMPLDKFQNLCMLYALVEPALYRWVGDGRDRNIHCLPWYAAEADLDSLCGAFRAPEHGLAHFRSISRYSGLNLNALTQFGTVEFRHLKTTTDLGRMMDWVNILLSLKVAAIQWQGTPAQLIKEMKILGPYAFLHRVFGPKLVSKLWHPSFSTTFRGISLPVAEYLVSNSVKLTAADLNRKLQLHVRNDQDEQGEHPGWAKWMKKRSSPKPRVKKTVNPGMQAALDSSWASNTSLSGYTLSMGTVPVPSDNNYVAFDDIVESTQTTEDFS